MPEAVERAKVVFDSTGMTRAMKVVAAVSLLLALLVGVKQYQLANCVARYSDQYNAVAVQRGVASQATNDAVDKFIRATVASTRAGSTLAKAAAFQQAYEDYIVARARADALRQFNPLPEPPSARC